MNHTKANDASVIFQRITSLLVSQATSKAEATTFGIQFEYFAIYRQPSGDFCQNRQFRQNRHFCQNRQPPRGHFWHPIQIARGW